MLRNAIKGSTTMGFWNLMFGALFPRMNHGGGVLIDPITQKPQVDVSGKLVHRVNAGANLHQFAGAIVQRFG
jgi:hypothetical protein